MFTPTTNYASATFEKCFPIYLYLTSRKCLFSLKNEQYYKRKSCPKMHECKMDAEGNNYMKRIYDGRNEIRGTEAYKNVHICKQNGV